MASSRMLHRVTLVRTNVSEELSASVISITRIGELGTLAVTSNRRTMQGASVASYGYFPSSPILVTLMMEALSSSETLVLTRATRRNIPEDSILLHQSMSHSRGPRWKAVPSARWYCFTFPLQITSNYFVTFHLHVSLKLLIVRKPSFDTVVNKQWCRKI
jgi:hypothetical protein